MSNSLISCLVTPFATKEEYLQRRKSLFNKLPSSSLTIISSAKEVLMSNDIPYPFRQNTNFHYLSGFDEPSSILVLEKTVDGKEVTHLFCQPNDPQKEMWDGARTGPSRAQAAFNMDFTYQESELGNFLSLKVPEVDNIFVSKDKGNDTFEVFLRDLKKSSVDITETIESLRVIKTEAEIEIMKKSCEISGIAFQEVMRRVRPGMSELEIEGIMDFECKKRGSKRLAYPPVVASGISTNTLHYVFNDSIVEDGQLILLDAGGEFFNYASDITRTFPVSGVFSPAQRDIYSAVLNAQKKCIELCRTHFNGTQPMSLYTLHLLSVRFLAEELHALGLVKNENDIHRFYPHMIGHYLGMDTHDVSSVSVGETLQPGMIVTVEPGIYVPDEPDIPEKYRGIGVRIEDDILITTNDPVNLTKLAPKEIEEIESIMSRK